MIDHRQGADVIADILTHLSRQGVAVLETARTGYGCHFWVAARPPNEPAGVRLYVLRRIRGRWSVAPSVRQEPWAQVPPQVLEAVRG